MKGDLGSGKTTLARALIRSLTQNPTLEVPSPTFTLIQSYDGCEKIHHLDLYRLESPEEIDELGLDDFLTEGIALIEWPERAQKKLPEENIRIEFFHEEEGRHLLLTFMDSEQKRFLAI